MMSLLAALLMYFYVHNLNSAWMIPSNSQDFLRFVAFISCGSLICIGTSHVIEALFPSYEIVKLELRAALGTPNFVQSFALAALSAIGEEVFFRGALQPIVGILGTSVIFGLLHLSPGGRVSIWTGMAFLAGLFLGWVTEQCGSLLPSIAIHFTVNMIGILELRKLNLADLAKKIDSESSHA